MQADVTVWAYREAVMYGCRGSPAIADAVNIVHELLGLGGSGFPGPYGTGLSAK